MPWEVDWGRLVIVVSKMATVMSYFMAHKGWNKHACDQWPGPCIFLLLIEKNRHKLSSPKLFYQCLFQVNERLEKLETVNSFTEFVQTFSQFGAEMVELAHISGDRQNVSIINICFW